mgnify:CR=1 FL=1
MIEAYHRLSKLNEVVQQCVAAMQQDANRERVIIRTSLPKVLPPVMADARSLRQIVLVGEAQVDAAQIAAVQRPVGGDHAREVVRRAGRAARHDRGRRLPGELLAAQRVRLGERVHEPSGGRFVHVGEGRQLQGRPQVALELAEGQRGDAVAQPGTRQRQEAGPGADVEHVGRRGRQQPDQGGVPGRPLGRRGGAVVR